MATLINNTRRILHLPRKFENGRDPFVEAKGEDGKRIKVPNEGEAFGGNVFVPAVSFDDKRRPTPGKLEVPDWYLELLADERGWARRLATGGGVEARGFGGRIEDPPADAARLKELEAKLKRSERERDSEREGFEQALRKAEERHAAIEKRVKELEAELSAKAAAPKTEKPKSEKTEKEPKPT